MEIDSVTLLAPAPTLDGVVRVIEQEHERTNLVIEGINRIDAADLGGLPATAAIAYAKGRQDVMANLLAYLTESTGNRLPPSMSERCLENDLRFARLRAQQEAAVEGGYDRAD